MNNSPFNPERFFKSACLFEAALILVAVVLGWLSGINPFADLHLTESAILYGILGTIPLFLLFLLLEHLSADSVVTIRRFLLETLGPLCIGIIGRICSSWQLSREYRKKFCFAA